MAIPLAMQFDPMGQFQRARQAEEQSLTAGEQFRQAKIARDRDTTGRLVRGVLESSPEQRSLTYKSAIEMAQNSGLDTRGMPTEYSKDVEPMLRNMIGVSTLDDSSREQTMKTNEAIRKAEAQHQNRLAVARAGATRVAVGGSITDKFSPGEKTRQKEQAKLDVKNIQKFKLMQSNMPHLRNVVKDLSKLGKKATYTLAGRAKDELRKEFQLGASEGAKARTAYQTRISNVVLPLLKQTFGAAFTEKEGATLRATLGDANKTPEEKQESLNAFISQKEAELKSQGSLLGFGTGESGLEQGAKRTASTGVQTPQQQVGIIGGQVKQQGKPISGEDLWNSL